MALDGRADAENLTLTAQVGASFRDALPPRGLPLVLTLRYQQDSLKQHSRTSGRRTREGCWLLAAGSLWPAAPREGRVLGKELWTCWRCHRLLKFVESQDLQAKASVHRERCARLQRPTTCSPVGPGTTAELDREETTAHLGRASHHLGERRGQQAVPSSRILKLGTRPLAYTWKGQSLCWVATRGSPAPPIRGGKQLISGDSLPCM